MKFFLGFSVGILSIGLGLLYIKIDKIENNVLHVCKSLEFLEPTIEQELGGCSSPSEN